MEIDLRLQRELGKAGSEIGALYLNKRSLCNPWQRVLSNVKRTIPPGLKLNCFALATVKELTFKRGKE